MLQEIFIVAGPNGAGKTTFAQEFVAEQPRPFLSADAIAARLHPLIYEPDRLLCVIPSAVEGSRR